MRVHLIKSTDNGQKYSDAAIFLYIFHIKLWILKKLFWSQFMSYFDNFWTSTNRIKRSYTV